MKNGIYIVFSIVLLIIGYRIIDDLNAAKTHLGDVSCNDCHLARGTIDQTNAKTLVANQEALCRTCHENASYASHPTGFKPNNQLSAQFPLDWKGELTCSTCHDVHGTKPGLLRVDLRRREFCYSCHNEKFFSAMKDRGSSVMLSGHLDARDLGESIIDHFSVQCMACHDSLTNDLRVQLSGSITRHFSQQVTHPIGMDYEKSNIRGGFQPAASLPEIIVLPDGMVSCISCHEGYSEKHGKLVMSNENSALCFACHKI